MLGQMVAERSGRRVVGLLGDHHRLGDDQATEVVPPQRQLEVIEARGADLLHGRPDARGAVAIGETAQDALHRDRPVGDKGRGAGAARNLIRLSG
jgi:hypothetical protein